MNTLISVNKDGSGTIEQSVIPKGMMAQFSAFAALNESKTGQSKYVTPETPEEKKKREAEKKAAELKKHEEKAKLFGEGVKFVSAEGQGNGFDTKEIFSFKDINKIKVAPFANSEKDLKNPLTFSFQNQKGLRKLVINKPLDKSLEKSDENPELKQGEKQESKEVKPEEKTENTKVEPEPKNKEMTPEQIQMLKSFFDGMKVNLVVKVDGEIKDTNATFVEHDKSQVVLMDADFGKLIGNPDFLPYAEKISKSQQTNKSPMQ
ncbi:MAG: hypothetical protein SFU25_10610, partial [Candidatus Caenarcaniphilales bacterium]|nr:hypothetical protein [Candidatus Caenarcaniphilales bacterium]